MIRIPRDLTLREVEVAFQDTEQRLRLLEKESTPASEADVDRLRAELADLKALLNKSLGDLTIYASQVINIPTTNMPEINVQRALNRINSRATVYDDSPQYFTLKPGCLLKNSANFSHNSSGNYLQMTLNTVNEDNNDMGDTKNNRIVVKTGGVYEVVAQCHWGTHATGYRIGQVRLNGSGVNSLSQFTVGNATNNVIQHIAGYVRLAKGDLLTLWQYQDSGTTLTCVAGYYGLAAQWVRF